MDTVKCKIGDREHLVLNIICHGTSFQVAARLRDATSGEAWRVFAETWLRFFHSPEIVITDGGTEFLGEFGRKAESQGIYQHVCDADSPWQNGKAERHGGLLKEVLDKAIEGEVITSVEELDLLLATVTADKNRYSHRGGFSFYQLAFKNPRLP